MLSVDETVATELLHAAYGDNLQRMAEVKKGYDPDNLFRLTNNVTQRDSPTPPVGPSCEAAYCRQTPSQVQVSLLGRHFRASTRRSRRQAVNDPG